MAEFRKSFSRPANLKSSDMQKIKELYERLENKEDKKEIETVLSREYESILQKQKQKERDYLNQINYRDRWDFLIYKHI
jgi:hypothetical protein